MIKIVTASHNAAVLGTNLKRSAILDTAELIVQTGYDNIAKAYNEAPITRGEITIYVHHDVWLPNSFESDLMTALANVPFDWDVLGVAGVRLDKSGRKMGYGNIMDRGREWGIVPDQPVRVQTLDEMLLITRGDTEFDENLPQDFYGADICMRANLAGKSCYAINAFCAHNSSRKIGERTPSFYESEKYFRQKYIDHLPIVTTCSLLT